MAARRRSPHAPIAAQRRSPFLALIVVLVIGAGGALLYLLSQPDEEEALPTATPDVFQNEGDGFGAIETLPPPEPEVVFVAPDPAEPNAELLAQITALQAQIEELRNAPEPVVEEDTAAAEAIDEEARGRQRQAQRRHRCEHRQHFARSAYLVAWADSRHIEIF